MKLDIWKMAGYVILLLPVAMCYYAWMALLHIGHDVLHPVMEQPEAIQAVVLMCGANMFGVIGTTVLAYWFYFRACEKMKDEGKE